jgi:hypothetical protein
LGALEASRLARDFESRHEYISARRVASSYLSGHARSASDLIAFALDRSENAGRDRWTCQAVVRAAAELGPEVLDEFLAGVSESYATSRDLVSAAICGGTVLPEWGADRSHASHGGVMPESAGWVRATSDPASRALLAVAFGSNRVPVEFHKGSGREAVYDQVWMGLRVRDMGVIDEDQLWRFYERVDEHAKTIGAGFHASRDAIVRSWLVDMGSRRITNSLREACVDIASSGLGK